MTTHQEQFEQQLLRPQKMGLASSRQESIDIALRSIAIELCDLFEIQLPTESQIIFYATQLETALKVRS